MVERKWMQGREDDKVGQKKRWKREGARQRERIKKRRETGNGRLAS